MAELADAHGSGPCGLTPRGGSSPLDRIAFYSGCHAVVAELADALASGASGSNTVEVRVLSTAPYIKFYPSENESGGFYYFGGTKHIICAMS